MVGDTRVESWVLTAEAWAELKASYRTAGLLMTCGQPGVPKTSALGTQFFAHKPGIDCGAHEGGPETAEHLRAKAIIAETARALDWEATVEYPADDRSWIADVLVKKGDQCIALEVQWSPQSNVDFRRRQTRYKEAGIDCLWFAGVRNKQNVAGVPSFALSGTRDELLLAIPTEIGVPATPVPLAEAVTHILNRSIRVRLEARTTGFFVETKMEKCWSDTCGKWMSLWYLGGLRFETRCGKVGAASGIGYLPWLPRRIEEDVQTLVREAFASSSLPSATIYGRKFSRIKNVFYMAQNCPHCGVVQGDGIAGDTRFFVSYAVPAAGSLGIPAHLLRTPHLCMDSGRGICVQGPHIGDDVPMLNAWGFTQLNTQEEPPSLPLR